MDGVDLDRAAQLLPLMGQERLLELAGLLADGLAVLAELPVADHAEHLHRLQGGAATLGFAGLAAQLAAAQAGDGDIAAFAGIAPAVVPALAAALHEISRQR